MRCNGMMNAFVSKYKRYTLILFSPGAYMGKGSVIGNKKLGGGPTMPLEQTQQHPIQEEENKEN